MLFSLFKNRVRLPDALRQKIARYITANYENADFSQNACFRGARQECKSISIDKCAMPAPIAVKPATLETILKQTDAGFTETPLKLIDKTGKKDSEIYNRANVSRQHFSKIRNNPAYKPTKPTALAFAIALELDLEQTKDLIGRAGYALTNSSKFDVIVRFFIESGNYNMMEINIALYEFDQPLLGS